MKKQLLLLCTTCLLMAFIPAKQMTATQPKEKLIQTFVVHTFHRENITGSDGHTYYVTLDFNLATQLFGVITAHDVLYPNTELGITRTAGNGTTLNGNGSTIDITLALALSIDGTSTTLSIATGTGIPFDY